MEAEMAEAGFGFFTLGEVTDQFQELTACEPYIDRGKFRVGKMLP